MKESDVGVSISELKRNPAAVISAAREQQVAITSRKKPVAYMVSPEVWERMLDLLDDAQDVRLVRDRLENSAPRIRVEIDDLVQA